MASGGNILALLVVGIGGFYAYSQGWLCKLNIPQLCPGGGMSPGDEAIIDRIGHPGARSQEIAPGLLIKHGGHIQNLTDSGGYGDYSGYGSDYGFDANVAHISIA